MMMLQSVAPRLMLAPLAWLRVYDAVAECGPSSHACSVFRPKIFGFHEVFHALICLVRYIPQSQQPSPLLTPLLPLLPPLLLVVRLVMLLLLVLLLVVAVIVAMAARPPMLHDMQPDPYERHSVWCDCRPK